MAKITRYISTCAIEKYFYTLVMPQPNILIILTDQLRRQALSCYGETNLQTPNIDALADSGARFANSYSTYPICNIANRTLSSPANMTWHPGI